LHPALYDLIYAGIGSSRAYRAVLADLGLELPDWVIPLSALRRSTLERIALEMRLNPNDSFVDLACGLGGPGLWIAESAAARLVGVDFSPVAISKATALASERGFASRARFVLADAAHTGLPTGAYDALVSIDSLQFMDAAATTREISRILKHGAAAVVTTWEALTDVELPTVVRQYEPFFTSAGMTVTKHEILEDARKLELAHYRSMLRHSAQLREEMNEAAEPLLHEAESGLRRENDAPRVRKVLIVARK
jgi:ubiquinone/menaquinone biosynthesis C-methylase UbiE